MDTIPIEAKWTPPFTPANKPRNYERHQRMLQSHKDQKQERRDAHKKRNESRKYTLSQLV